MKLHEQADKSNKLVNTEMAGGEDIQGRHS